MDVNQNLRSEFLRTRNRRVVHEADFLLMGTALNMFDTWLPIISGLSKKGFSGSVIFSYDFILARADGDDTTLAIADEIFESVYVFSRSRLHHFSSIRAAWQEFGTSKIEAKKRNMSFSRFLWKIYRFLLMVAGLLNSIEECHARRLVNSIPGRVLLYDLTNRTQDKMFHDKVEHAATRAGFKIFSLPHAPVPVMAEERGPKAIPDGWTHVSHLVQDWGGGSNPSRTGTIMNQGIPRHDPDWVTSLVAKSREIHGDPPAPYAVLMSHGGGPGYSFSEKSKVRVIEHLGALLRDMGIGLVVKRHPTEELPPGENFSVSGAHPLHLLRDARAMIVFLSSTVADGLLFNKPIIQILGITSDFSSSKNPELTWAEKSGVAIPCQTFQEFNYSFRKFGIDYFETENPTRSRYSDILLRPDNASLVSIIQSAVRT